MSTRKHISQLIEGTELIKERMQNRVSAIKQLRADTFDPIQFLREMQPYIDDEILQPFTTLMQKTQGKTALYDRMLHQLETEQIETIGALQSFELLLRQYTAPPLSSADAQVMNVVNVREHYNIKEEDSDETSNLDGSKGA